MSTHMWPGHGPNSSKKYMISMLFLFQITTYIQSTSLAYADYVSLETMESSPPIRYYGNGCLEGTVTANFTTRSTNSAPAVPTYLDIFFAQYQTHAGKAFGRHVSRKTCNLTVLIQIPQNVKIAILMPEYHGYNSLPMGAVSTVNLGYFFKDTTASATSKTHSIRRLFYGEQNQAFSDSVKASIDETHWSPCGGEVELHIASGLQSETNPYNETASTSLSSNEQNPSLRLQLDSMPCFIHHSESE